MQFRRTSIHKSNTVPPQSSVYQVRPWGAVLVVIHKGRQLVLGQATFYSFVYWLISYSRLAFSVGYTLPCLKQNPPSGAFALRHCDGKSSRRGLLVATLLLEILFGLSQECANQFKCSRSSHVIDLSNQSPCNQELRILSVSQKVLPILSASTLACIKHYQQTLPHCVSNCQ